MLSDSCVAGERIFFFLHHDAYFKLHYKSITVIHMIMMINYEECSRLPVLLAERMFFLQLLINAGLGSDLCV